ncbi:hypothetical protein [Rathayibacter soli]|uniref:hypothetical protein n=1 Tax=Rathayibacter soli TaxID=3144168 RepID=UPI0027E449A8|nr:hypothetical protein [Glaciibacter superstes]
MGDVEDEDAARPAELATTHYSPGIVSPQAVYGTVVVAAILGATSDDASAWEIFFMTVGSVLVLWTAHVYAEAVASHGRQGEKTTGVRQSLKFGVRQSFGILLAATIPAVLLFLGALGPMDGVLAVDLSLWWCVLALGILGYFAFQQRGRNIPIRIIGAIATAAFGVVIIVLKTLAH